MRLPVLVLVLAVLLMLPLSAQGAVSDVPGVPGCTVHSSIDAYVARGTGHLGILPADGSDWDWDVECNKTSTKEHVAVAEEVYRLAITVGTEFFDDMRVLILPTDSFVIESDPDEEYAGL